MTSSVNSSDYADPDDGRYCQTCGKAGNLMHCGACGKASYCSRACQKKDWKAHKPLCNPEGPPSKKLKPNPSDPSSDYITEPSANWKAGGTDNTLTHMHFVESDSVSKFEYRLGVGLVYTGNKKDVFNRMLAQSEEWHMLHRRAFENVVRHAILHTADKADMDKFVVFESTYVPDAVNPAARFPILSGKVVSKDEMLRFAEETVPGFGLLVDSMLTSAIASFGKQAAPGNWGTTMTLVRNILGDCGLPNMLKMSTHSFSKDEACDPNEQPEMAELQWLDATRLITERGLVVTHEGEMKPWKEGVRID